MSPWFLPGVKKGLFIKGMTNACTAGMQQCFPDCQSWMGYSSLLSCSGGQCLLSVLCCVMALCGNPLDLWNGREDVLSKSCTVRLTCLYVYLFPTSGRAAAMVQRFGGSEASTSCQFYFLADFCPHPGINICIHTSLGRGSRGCT